MQIEQCVVLQNDTPWCLSLSRVPIVFKTERSFSSVSNLGMANSISSPHSPCVRFKKHLTQGEFEFQVD